ncbi:DUF4434 domain-containing protein [Bacteroidota bacterium]
MISRRSFLQTASIAGISTLFLECSTAKETSTKYIQGSWIEFQHHNKKEGKYWNATCASFSAEQWEAKIKEMAEIGMEYLVLLCTALDFKSFYPTKIFPPWKIGCDDPVEVVLAAADKFGIKFFISGGFYGEWTDPKIFSDKEAKKKRLAAIEEIAGIYGHHKSFHGWYWPNEAAINPYFRDDFMKYTNECSSLARSLTPDSKILIAPYGTRLVKPDDNYIKQLDTLDVDVIAYQDEVGVKKSIPEETPAFFEGLRKAHDRVGKIALWADVEIFDFEGEVYRSALIPAPFNRILKQIESISSYVDTILVYQYQGMMSKPGSIAYAGHPNAAKLYGDYRAWLENAHSKVIRK